MFKMVINYHEYRINWDKIRFKILLITVRVSTVVLLQPRVRIVFRGPTVAVRCL